MTNPEWETARRAACKAAADVWKEIYKLYENGSHVEEKADGPSTEADKLSDRLLQEILKAEFPEPEYGYLTEETKDNADRLRRDRVWIIDPIDGTMDFIKKNGNFSMHIAMAERMEDGAWHPVASAVYRPVPGHMYSAVRGAGATLTPYADHAPAGDPTALGVSSNAAVPEMRAVISNSHRTGPLNDLMDHMKFADVLSIGSIGIKVSLIASGERDVYVNLARGKCKEWDICAPELILNEAGGKLTGLDGSSRTYNQKDVKEHAGLLATNNRIHDEIVRRIEEFEAARA